MAEKRGLDVEPSEQQQQCMKRQALDYVVPPHVAAYIAASCDAIETFDPELSEQATYSQSGLDHFHSPHGNMSPFPSSDAFLAPVMSDLDCQKHL